MIHTLQLVYKYVFRLSYSMECIVFVPSIFTGLTVIFTLLSVYRGHEEGNKQLTCVEQ